ncbi:Peptide-methionine (S)-S-oxide reductase [Physocladia obscura]|uniref:peptide-methionine (S)-S-oxide reductase n=1 Tax=Physocladia obscura TaxID=109957 RepID=A0AAD5XGE9_9FUNG|nr:Peptide-methionine (S)-S-oxide reductase [Physocladia obscura]
MTKNFATLGAGTEKIFRKKFGALLVNPRVGYSGGTKDDPTYQEVCSKTTNHAEVLQFEFDDSTLPYEAILDFFFRMHDPTTLNRQGGDIGTQYRSAIFFHDASQKEFAESFIARIQPAFGISKITTTLEPFRKFWDGEEYHQDYLTKNPDGYECPLHFERSWEKIATQFGGSKI